ncbi:MAG: PEP-CTERM sorting domain-containing protein [Oscillatoria sp. SIO1A7]|nr:PEP-CTERM sorting domain-containing protein [Oscillatoria sp. SIO1A7]
MKHLNIGVMNNSAFINKCSIAIASVGAIALGANFAAPVQAQQTVITGFSTGGGDMDGMEVIVRFLDGTFEKEIWGTDITIPNAGGASGTDWDLTFSGSTTFGTPWTFNANNPLLSLSINGIPGNTAFDDGSFPSTPGSSGGWSFEVISGEAPDDWEYSIPIDISEGDIWGTLSMNWIDGFTGTMQFIADTDNGSVSNPIAPAQAAPAQVAPAVPIAIQRVAASVPAQVAPARVAPAQVAASAPAKVPEPGTAIALLGFAALGIGSIRRGKQDQSS